MAISHNKQVAVDTIHWMGTNWEEVWEFINNLKGNMESYGRTGDNLDIIKIKTTKDEILVPVGGTIARDVKGHLSFIPGHATNPKVTEAEAEQLTARHTEEPWIVVRRPSIGTNIEWGDGKEQRPICHMRWTDGLREVVNKAVEADAHRIVACVNACAGMVDPKDEIARLRQDKHDLLEAAGSALWVLHNLPPVTFASTAEASLKTAIAKATHKPLEYGDSRILKTTL